MLINSALNSIYQQSSNTREIQKSDSGKKFADLLHSHQKIETSRTTLNATNDSAQKFDTNKGVQDINLNDYFSSKPIPGTLSLMDMPLLLPTQHNIDTLSKYSEKQFKGLMEKYDIPAPPATIEFDSEGQLVLPDDYPYAIQLKQALKESPEVVKALQTTAALASHFAGIMEGQAWRDEMSTARTQADRDRIIEKHSYLFDDNRPAPRIVLAFTEDGDMLVGGKSSSMENQLADNYWLKL
jgi:vancomycin resistance protein YoaR